MQTRTPEITMLVFIALAALGCGGKTVAASESKLSDLPASGGVGAPIGEAGSAPSQAAPPAAVGEAGIAGPLPNQFVNFRLTNTGTNVIYLAELSRGCTVYSIEGLDGQPAPQLVWPGDTPSCLTDSNWGYADTFRRMAPGESEEMEWDATEVVATMSNGCRVGTMVPVPPGSYRVTFGYELSPPSGCSQPDPARPELYYCPDRPGLPGGLVYAPLCPTGKVASAQFVLPQPPTNTDAAAHLLVDVSANAGP